jgi:hypothetical protein
MIPDVAQIAPRKTSIGRDIILEVGPNSVTMYVPNSRKWGGGRESKKIAIKRFLVLDSLFFEGLGLWVGEGGKRKGMYFGNSCPELILRFIDFVEGKLGINRQEFKVTINVSTVADRDTAKERWSKMLRIPTKNFTSACIDSRINREYAQLYLNSIVLVEFMNRLHQTLESTILADEKFAAAFLRGLFAAEGQVCA